MSQFVVPTLAAVGSTAVAKVYQAMADTGEIKSYWDNFLNSSKMFF